MTPLMQQYHVIKNKYPHALILFQVGDFYELFYADAQKAAQFLNITLTKRGKSEGEPIPLCGFPRHAADQYIIKLVQGGFHVVICDQQGEVESGKLVERRVTAVLTPGMLHDARLLDARTMNMLVVLGFSADNIALWCFELVSGYCTTTIISRERHYMVEAELVRYSPREIVVHTDVEYDDYANNLEHKGYRVSRMNQLVEESEYDAWLRAHTHAEAHLFITHAAVLYKAGKLLYSYIKHHVPEGISPIQTISLYAPDDFLLLDAVTQRDLELVHNTYDHSAENTLWYILDHAATAMGSRRIRRWILQPLCHKQAIETRLNIVEQLVNQPVLRKQIYEFLRTVGDIERIVGRILLHRATYSDYKVLQQSLEAIIGISHCVTDEKLPILSFSNIVQERKRCMLVAQRLEAALQNDMTQEGKIKTGYHAELDKIRALSKTGKEALCAYEEHEKTATGIGSLKIRSHNEVYGYGIEVTKTHRHLIPERYRLVQALVNRDRFTTPELLQLEHDIQHAQKRAQELDQELFNNIISFVEQHALPLRAVAEELAHLDGYLSFAQAAVVHRYVKPTITVERKVNIKQGRHPIVEYRMRQQNQYYSSDQKTLNNNNSTLSAHHFVANNVVLHDSERLWIITGPNMGGKSTFLRQVALIAIMAQSGSFVPAQQAELPIFDRLFTRIGAIDKVNEGKSTFWVEMEEVARMCQEATPRSLIILDEVGRGTSTYDGMSIAQAVLEHLEEHVRAFGLCATHYHEIVRVLGTSQRAIGLYHVATATVHGEMILLHEIRPGIAESSFGLVVAEKAGILPQIISRAQEVLTNLQNSAL
jgi:DNA mismatch repair protein MutS